MGLDYKRRLGAKFMGREDFIGIVKCSRVENKGVVLECGGGRINAKELLDWEKSREDDTIPIGAVPK
jgi:hypothetical protein